MRLLDYEESVRALLVERCVPGSQLWSVEDEDEATRIAASVLRRIWRPAPSEHRFRTLADEAARWVLDLPAAWEALGDLLSSELGLDHERMRRWGIAHALAWGFSGRKVEQDMIECARLLIAAA